MVRLEGEFFPFSLANPEGADIRFTKSNGKPNGLESIQYFKGWMDEVRFYSEVQEMDQVRLNFESQRPNAKLIKFSRP